MCKDACSAGDWTFYLDLGQRWELIFILSVELHLYAVTELHNPLKKISYDSSLFVKIHLMWVLHLFLSEDFSRLNHIAQCPTKLLDVLCPLRQNANIMCLVKSNVSPFVGASISPNPAQQRWGQTSHYMVFWRSCRCWERWTRSTLLLWTHG